MNSGGWIGKVKKEALSPGTGQAWLPTLKEPRGTPSFPPRIWDFIHDVSLGLFPPSGRHLAGTWYLGKPRNLEGTIVG